MVALVYRKGNLPVEFIPSGTRPIPLAGVAAAFGYIAQALYELDIELVARVKQPGEGRIHISDGRITPVLRIVLRIGDDEERPFTFFRIGHQSGVNRLRFGSKRREDNR